MRFVDTVTPQLREVRPQGYPKRMQSRCGEEIKATQGWPPMSHHVFSSRAAWTADIGTSDEMRWSFISKQVGATGCLLVLSVEQGPRLRHAVASGRLDQRRDEDRCISNFHFILCTRCTIFVKRANIFFFVCAVCCIITLPTLSTILEYPPAEDRYML
jgi:hypothetical protein